MHALSESFKDADLDMDSWCCMEKTEDQRRNYSERQKKMTHHI